MRHRQHQKQQQKMALTPQMRQSLELLAMPIKELGEYVESILEKNPFLKKEADRKSLYRDKHYNRSSSVTTDKGSAAQVRNANDPRSELLSQLKMLDLSDTQIKIGEYLIYEMDDNGYITTGIAEAASDLAVDEEEADTVLGLIQEMDPPGIGARDAAECLELQLKRAGKEASLEYSIVKDFLGELASGNIKKIASSLHVSEVEVLNAVKNIKKLNPRPASTMLGKPSEAVIPDLVAHINRKKVSIGLNRDWFPKLKFYNPYENKPDIIKDDEVRSFIKANEQAAKSLLDSLKRREDTMCKVASFILGSQIDALRNNKNSIKPLTIRDCAQTLKLHQSTISRTVSNKYIQLKERVFPLKSLLSGGVKKTDGRTISRQAVMERIASMVSGEDRQKPLDDSEIRQALGKEGVIIERRTVAKYRNAIRILPKHLRRNKTY